MSISAAFTSVLMKHRSMLSDRLRGIWTEQGDEFMRIGYLGFSCAMLQALFDSKDFEVATCICERSRWHEGLAKLLSAHETGYVLIEDKAELQQAIAEAGVDTFLMCAFGMILPSSVTENYRVINFHPGSLENNRGRTPVVNSILRGDSYSKMTAHTVNGGIDEGIEVSSRIVEITSTMDSQDLARLLDAQLVSMLPEVRDYLENGCTHAAQGLYCSRISADSACLDLSKDWLAEVTRKVKSQAAYGGATAPQGKIHAVEVKGYQWQLQDERTDEIIYRVIAEVHLRKGAQS